MTLGQYKRLLLVVSLPLLLAGFVLYRITVPYPERYFLLCMGTQCSYFGGSDNRLHKSRYAQYPAWFQVAGDIISDKHNSYYVEASQTMVGPVTIDNFRPYAFSGTNPESAAKILGREANLVLGMQQGDQTIDLGATLLLSCNTLRLNESWAGRDLNPAPFQAACFGPDWSGHIEFSPSPTAKEEIEALRKAVKEWVVPRETEFEQRRIAILLTPIAFFLVLSLLVWLVGRAVAFVRAG